MGKWINVKLLKKGSKIVMRNLKGFPAFNSFGIKHRKVVSEIAAEYPFSVEFVSRVFINQKYSAINTRKILENMLWWEEYK